MPDDYHLPEDDNHHSHRRGNLKSYINYACFDVIVYFSIAFFRQGNKAVRLA
jgi:hypothetical protein